MANLDEFCPDSSSVLIVQHMRLILIFSSHVQTCREQVATQRDVTRRFVSRRSETLSFKPFSHRRHLVFFAASVSD